MRERKSKRCNKCKQYKKFDMFSKDRTRKDGLYPYCKACARKLNYNNYSNRDKEKRAKQDHDRHLKDKDTQYWKDIKRIFNLSKDDWIAIAERQKYVCAICKEPEIAVDKRTGRPRRLAVDHCHTTNKVRGLLCGNCNKGLGSFKDSVANMNAAIEYLKVN